MSQSYNAFLRETDLTTGKSRVVGRALITNKTKLPPSYILTFGSRQANAGTVRASQFIEFASQTKPLQVYVNGITKEDPEDLLIRVNVKRLVRDAVVQLEIFPSKSKIKEVKAFLERKYEIDSHRFFLSRGSVLLNDEKTLEDYNFKDDCEILMHYKHIGGGDSLISVDISSGTITGRGGTHGPKWLTYNYGLNVFGTCTNPECASNQAGRSGKVICQYGYGRLVLTPEDNSVPCSTCKNGKVLPSNFLVSNGRSLFRFKKVGEGEEVKQRVLESAGSSLNEYVMFNSKESGVASYDLIDIETVGRAESPFTCVSCLDGIPLRYAENILEGCGHAYHRDCSSGGGCSAACNVGVAFWSEEEMNSECEKQLLLKAEGWQRNSIKDNLTKLMENTICDIPLLNYLLENDAISSSDKHALEIIQNMNERATKLYELVPSKTNGFVVLTEALREQKQTVAAKLLMGELSKYDRTTWGKIINK